MEILLAIISIVSIILTVLFYYAENIPLFVTVIVILACSVLILSYSLHSEKSKTKKAKHDLDELEKSRKALGAQYSEQQQMLIKYEDTEKMIKYLIALAVSRKKEEKIDELAKAIYFHFDTIKKGEKKQ
jgi:hypothetical protein